MQLTTISYPESQISNPEAPKLVVIGGGTGPSSILYGTKYLTPNVTGVINMCDDGDSSGRLVQEYGVHPPGDVRINLAALTNNNELSELINERIEGGIYDGHARGNLLLAYLELKYGSFEAAVDIASKLFGITGAVLPVTLDRHTLVMRDGEEIIRGESKIDKRQYTSLDRSIWLEPDAILNPKAEEALYAADVVVIAHGSLETSLLPPLSVRGMKETLRDTKARKVMVANLLNQPGQTDGWHVADYIRALERYLFEGTIDTALYNTDLPSRNLINRHGNRGEATVSIEESRFKEVHAQAIGAALLSKTVSVKPRRSPNIWRVAPELTYDPHIVARHLISFAV